MADIHRSSEVDKLTRLLTADGPFRICGINGPGGVGKTFLVQHVLDEVGLADHGYLQLGLSGANAAVRGDFLGLVEGELARRSLPPPVAAGTDYFPQTRKIAQLHRALLAEAEQSLGESGAPEHIRQLASLLLTSGQVLNRALPRTRDFVDFDRITVTDDDVEAAYKALQKLEALKESSKLPGLFRDMLGITLRNRVKTDLYGVTADALVSDLSVALTGDQGKKSFKVVHDRIKHLRRLLIVIDDFEVLAPVLSTFLVGSLVPRLAEAPFSTVLLIIGRDDLESAEIGFAHHCQRYLELELPLHPFAHDEALAYLADAGVEPDVAERLYAATHGFPFLLTLAAEEARDGKSNTALFLRKFHERTTRWMSKTQREWFEIVCYLDAVSFDTLAAFFDAETVPRVQDWFESEASIRDPAAPVFTVRPLIREKVLRYLELRAPGQHRERLAAALAPATAVDTRDA